MPEDPLGPHDHDHDDGAASLLLSTRFWIFLALAFGLSGTLLTIFQLAGSILIFALASISGLLSGFLAAWVIRTLEMCGLAWDVVRIPPERQAAKAVEA